MKAAVLFEYGKPLVVDEVELDEPSGGEVLLRMVACGVCHSDYSYIDGTIRKELPIVLGHEGAGVVEKVGEGVTSVGEGDHAVLTWAAACGRCRYCTVGRPNLCDVGRGPEVLAGFMPDGTSRLHKGAKRYRHMVGLSAMAEYAVVPEASVIQIGRDVPLEKAALLGCGVTTGVGAALNTAKVEPGSRVAVFGLGGVGISAVQGAALAGAAMIVAIDVQPAKLELARSFGATHAINGSQVDAVARIQELTGGGVDYAFEAIGNVKVMRQAYDSICKGGTLVVIGGAAGGEELCVPAITLPIQEKSIRGSCYGSARPRVDIPRLIELYQAGRLKLDEMVTKTYSLEEVNEAMDDLISGRNIRGVLVME
jgi:S-(hydroxymethyl)glutathione dehydrogenase/alcohol dehydrogenase